MAYKLNVNAEEIKDRKISAFKRNKEMKQIVESYRESGDYS
ncbi:hypothetical protein PH210_06005 [Paenibacillus sp. BSR1-1]|nr:hypothetical protein [Paenibacillus sp. BSR1-1]MDN3015760.1 hypothetical protein [Paenibacillus sp. BSR1-1]